MKKAEEKIKAMITEEQLKTVNAQQLKLNESLRKIGIFEIQKQNEASIVKEVSLEIEATKKELEEEYGQVNIDLSDGSYTEVEKNDDNNIRKISIGADYKSDAMHYSNGQQVYGGHEISHILYEESDKSYNIFIKKNNEILPWKKFNSNMAISVEYDLEY